VAIEEIRNAIAEHQAVGLVTAILGSDHWRDGVIRGPHAFDFIVPALPQHGMSPGTWLIPFDLVIEWIHRALVWQFAIITVVKRICDLPIFHVEAPPPVESESLILRGVYGHFKEMMDEFGIHTVSHRFKLWWAWSHVAMHVCSEAGIHFIEGPAATRDDHGFLNEQYYADGVHGTDIYGGLIAGEIGNAMRGLGLLGG
jgi:hypothetical protein